MTSSLDEAATIYQPDLCHICFDGDVEEGNIDGLIDTLSSQLKGIMSHFQVDSFSAFETFYFMTCACRDRSWGRSLCLLMFSGLQPLVISVLAFHS